MLHRKIEEKIRAYGAIVGRVVLVLLEYPAQGQGWMEHMAHCFESSVGEVFLYVGNDEFDKLPGRLKDEILSAARSFAKESSGMSYGFENEDVCVTLNSRITNVARQRGRSEHRQSLERYLSAGVHERADLDEIFAIQEGRCYFTGEPLSRLEKNYSIDHIHPVRSGGSSWPGNLAFVLKSVNQEKHGHSPRKYWAMLQAKYGAEWVDTRKIICKEIDAKRRTVDRRRKATVAGDLQLIELALQVVFKGLQVSYYLDRECVTLVVEGMRVQFHAGFLRDGKRYKSADYVKGIVSALLSAP